MNCPKCGIIIPDDSSTCSCGHILNATGNGDLTSNQEGENSISNIDVNLEVKENHGTANAVHIELAQNVTIILSDHDWKLVGGDTLLSETKDGATKAQQSTDLATSSLSGPKLLSGLIQNYRNHLQPMAQHPLIVPNLKCFNQFIIRKTLSYPNTSIRIVELTGPSGIGKTHILRSICATSRQERGQLGISEEEWVGWQTVYFDAKKEHFSFEHLISAFASKLAATVDVLPKPEQELPPLIMRVVVRNNIRRILFVLDSADAIDLSVLAKLVSDEGPAGPAIRKSLPLAGEILLRLVIASRMPRVSQSLRSAPTNLGVCGVHSLQMDPLDRQFVRDMLIERIEAKNINGDLIEQVDRMATAIHAISGGHPHAISIILGQLEELEFAVEPDDLVKRFQPVILQIIQTDVIRNLSVEDYLLLNVLSVFRWFGIKTIMQLREIGLLPSDMPSIDDPKDFTAWGAWLENMRETTSYIRYFKDETSSIFAVHPVLRHVLPMDLRATVPELLYNLHQIAFNFYDQYLRSYDAARIRLAMPLDSRPIFMMEALYHYTQSRLIKSNDQLFDVQQLTALIEEYTGLYRQARDYEQGGFEPAPFALRKRWEIDTELQTCLAQFTGSNSILKTIEAILQ